MKLLSLAVLVGLGAALPVAAAPAEPLSVSVSQRRVARGELVRIVIAGHAGFAATSRIEAVLLQPRAGASSLALAAVPGKPGVYSASVHVGADAASGSYIVHAWSGEMVRPAALGKAIFLVGPVVADFAVPNYLDEADPAKDLDAYLADFVEIGGNFLVAHNLVTPDGSYYPSRVARIAARTVAPIDLVELILERADRLGLGVLLSVGWDQTRAAPYSARFAETTALIDELYERYAHHPSMVGFYSWQEGSGSYFAGYVRAFGDYVKKRNATLLTACAPHMDDPLLAGYLSAVESLDVIIYQSGTMASYRPDNRKRYPIRRVKDFCSLGAGAALLQDKIALSHVELFGYLETRTSDEIVTTTPGNITRQILSAATVPGSDGISMFTYLAHVHAQRRRHPEVERSRAAVRDALEAFRLASTVSARRNALAVYVPYSDWVIERWTTSFLPALDGFRLLGVPVDVLPWAPRADESVLPYYPIHRNERVLDRLLAERTVLVMPDVSGLQQTDSDLIEAFVKRGGVLVLFGPQTPMGRTFDRRALIGADERPPAPRRAIVVEEAAGTRASAGTRLLLEDGRWPAWQPACARVLARFDDGAAAVIEQRYGQGVVLAVAVDVQSAARHARAITLDVLDRALRSAGSPASLVVVDGTTIDTDVAINPSNAGARAAIVNHGVEPLDVVVQSDARRAGLRVRVPPGEARVVELVPERKQ